MTKLKINIVPSMKRLDLIIKGLSNRKFIGNYQSIFKGSGLEFSDFRPYDPSNDDANRIDWKTSARTLEPVVKEYVEERDIEVFFIIDVSSKMLTGSTKKLKCEYIADFVASLSHTILRAGDSVGIALFSDKIVKVIHPNNGIRHSHTILDSLSDLSYYGGNSDVKKALEFSLKSLDDGTIVFLISDFITEEDLNQLSGIVGHKFDFIAVIIRDPLDTSLPSSGVGQIVVKDPNSNERLILSPKKIAKYYALESRNDLEKIKKLFFKSNISVIELSTKDAFIKKLIEFFEGRKKKWK